MDRLSSCYFCGAALDATLEEHPVVPAQLNPGTDTRKTVVLCDTCRRKLDAVLDTVVDAVEASAGDLPAEGGDAESGDDLAETLGDDEEILTPLGDDDGAADAAEGDAESDGTSGDDSEDGDDESKPKYTDSRGAGFRREDEGPSEAGSLTGGAFSDDDEDDDSGSGSLTGDAFSGKSSGGSDRTGGGSPSGSNATDPSGASDGSSGGSSDDGKSGGSGDSGTKSGETRDISMTRLENTKVMRLLENREFPVDKAEFVTVAANAYQVSKDDCEKVIDLAVEHGLLREENGQLYAGDEA